MTQTHHDDDSWKTIPVPSNVELQGYGTPIYSNQTYPFKKDPPFVMGEPPQFYPNFSERNPVSSYRRTFTIPADWQDRQTTLTFNGVSSGALDKDQNHTQTLNLGIIKDVIPWTAGNPQLYSLSVSIEEGDNSPIATYSFKIGFKTSEIKDDLIIVDSDDHTLVFDKKPANSPHMKWTVANS